MSEALLIAKATRHLADLGVTLTSEHRSMIESMEALELVRLVLMLQDATRDNAAKTLAVALADGPRQPEE